MNIKSWINFYMLPLLIMSSSSIANTEEEHGRFMERASFIVPEHVANVFVMPYNLNEKSIIERPNNKVESRIKTIKGMIKALDDHDNADAITKVFKVDTDSRECIVIYKSGITDTTFDHELGHCFSQILFNKSPIIQERIEKYDVQKTTNDYADYLYELFAELSAATRTYYQDGNFAYIKNRVLEIKAKGQGTVYPLTIAALENIKPYLQDSPLKSATATEQVQHMIENYYEAVLLSPLLFKEGFNSAINYKFSGVWEGEGYQYNNRHKWTIRVEVSRGEFTIDYPSLACGGELRVIKSNLEQMRFNERLSYGKSKCINNGTTVLTITDDEAIDFAWYKKGKKEKGASGRLIKQQ